MSISYDGRFGYIVAAHERTIAGKPMFLRLLKVVYWAAYAVAVVMALFFIGVLRAWLTEAPGDINGRSQILIAAGLIAVAAWGTGRTIKYVAFGR